jgi:adenine-specific DNA-methyltransferase
MDIYPMKDLGFKVLHLNHSNFKDWRPYDGQESDQLETLFDHFETPLIEGWQPENLLTEILLLQGFPLDSRIQSLPEFKKNDVKGVSSEFCQHRLCICLDAKIQLETAALRLQPEDILVCLDSALSDEAKIQLSDQCNLKVI